MNRKIVLCDRYDANREATVIADCTHNRMIISKRQMKGAERRSRMMVGSYLVISGENKMDEVMDKSMEVYDEKGHLCAIIQNF